MVTDTSSIKITDFGIAKALRSSHLTDTGTVVGSPAYIAPERALGKGAGPLSDLYSVGIIAYELLAGAPPFLDTEPAAIVLQQVHAPVHPLDAKRPDLPGGLAEWVHRLLEKDPADRPQGAAVAWAELEPIVLDHRRPRPRERPEPAKVVVSALLHPVNLLVPLAVLAVGLAIDALWLVPVAVVAFAALAVISIREALGRTREEGRG